MFCMKKRSRHFELFTETIVICVRKENIQTLESFLICGPTSTIVSVPPELLSAIRRTQHVLEKQDESIREALEVTVCYHFIILFINKVIL